VSIFRAIRLRIVFVGSAVTSRFAVFMVPLLFGCYSLWLGADSNWDLHNYHLYGAFAFLNGKLSTDFAVAGLPSYFNPLLDTLVYALNAHLLSCDGECSNTWCWRRALHTRRACR